MALDEAADVTQEAGVGTFKPGGWSARLVALTLVIIVTGELGFLVFAYPLNVLPQIATEFQTGQVAWMQTAYALTAAVTAAITGKLADRFGPKHVLLAIIALVLIGSLVSTFATSFGVLILGRVLQGPALSILFIMPAVVRNLFPTKTVPLAVALSTSGSGILSVFATFALGALVTGFGFRVTFWMPAIAAAVLLIVVALFIPKDTEPTLSGPLDILGATLLGVGVAGVLLGVSLGPTWGWGSLYTILCLVGGAVVLAAWVFQSLRASAPLINLRELTHFPLTTTLILGAIGIASVTWFYVIMPIVALTPGGQLGWGLGMDQNGEALVAALYTTGGFISGFIVGRLLSRLSAPIVGVGVMVALTVGFVVALFGVGNPILFTISAVLIGGVSAGAYAVPFNLVILVVPPERQATTSAMVTLVGNLFAAILPVLLFTALTATASGTVQGTPIYSLDGLRWATLVPAALGLVGAAFAIALAVSRRGQLQAGTAS